MADFIMRLQYRDGTYIGEVPFMNLQGEFRMNEPDQIRFSISSRDLITYVNPVSQLQAGLTEVVLVRNGIKVFTGPIWDIDTTSEGDELNCTAEDISSYLDMRSVAVDTKFTKQRFAYAAWKLIQDAQAQPYGDLGIVLGQDAPTNPTGSVSFTKKAGESLLKNITNLATGTTGFDWEITPERKLMMYYPRIQTVSNIILEYGANVRRYSVQGMGKYIANEVFALGANKLVSTTYSDVASKQLYGLRQKAVSDTSIKSSTILNGYASGQLNLRKNPRLIPQLSMDSNLINPFEGDIGYGNLVTTIINDGWVQFNGVMRCSGFQLSVGKHGNETFVLYINDTREIEDTSV